eukprot:Skav207780  [mRNA]  locus=scaffold5169:10058:11003:- [translate_table: standard]
MNIPKATALLSVLFVLSTGSSCEESEESALITPMAIVAVKEREAHRKSFTVSQSVYQEYINFEKERLSLGSVSMRLTDPDLMNPLMEPAEIAFYSGVLSKADAYLEWGVGGSTVLATTQFPNLHCVKGIDSSEKWIEKVSAQPTVATAISRGFIQLKHVDIGPTNFTGYPTDPNSFAKWSDYSAETFGSCHRAAEHRVVLVAGRFRVACFLKMLASMSPEEASRTQLLLHDYDRESYHAVEQFANLIEILGANQFS